MALIKLTLYLKRVISQKFLALSQVHFNLKSIVLKKIFIILFISAALWACSHNSGNRSVKIIPKNKFIDVLTEVHILDAITNEPTYYRKYPQQDSIDLYGAIFHKFNITRADFDSTVSYYSLKPQKYIEIYDKVILNLNYRLDTMKKKAPKFSRELNKE